MSLTAQTVVVKPALDRPLSPKLEEFLTDICWRLQEMPDKPRMTLQDFADALRTKFKLGVPLMPQLHKFLAEMGVGLEWRDKAKGLDGSFDYDPIQGRWVIYIPADLGLRESFVIMHEVFELIFWRCYYRIGWWAEWAREEGFTDPHTKADEFAFFTIVPSTKFRNRAKKLGYDLWGLSTLCHVTHGSCFQALTRSTPFLFPFFHALLSIGTQPDQGRMIFDNDTFSTKVLYKNYKKPYEDEGGMYWEYLNPDQFLSWDAVGTFSSEAKVQRLPARKQCFEIRSDNLIYQAKTEAQPLSATTDRIAGVILDAPVDVIVSPKPDQPSLVYLQVMPAGFIERLLADKI